MIQMPATKRLYVAIAKAINDSAEDFRHHGWTPRSAAAHTVRALAVVLKEDNPRFRYDTFYEACGLDSYGYPEE